MNASDFNLFNQVFDANKFDLIGIREPCKSPWTFVLNDGGYLTFPRYKEGSSICGFDTKEDAEAEMARMLGDKTNYAYIVMKNGDFTEGRGPMYPLVAFSRGSDAHKYIMAQVGIYGSKQRCDINFGCNIYGNLYGYDSYNGYEIKKMTLDDPNYLTEALKNT